MCVNIVLGAEFLRTRPITYAFGANAKEFVAWKQHLESHGLELRLADHKLAWSLYFRDPWDNMFEITTYEYKETSQLLSD